MDNPIVLNKLYLNKIIDLMNRVIELTNQLKTTFGFKQIELDKNGNSISTNIMKLKSLLLKLNKRIKYFKIFSTIGGGNSNCNMTAVNEINQKIDDFSKALKDLQAYYITYPQHNKLVQIIKDLSTEVNTIPKQNIEKLFAQ
jgi:hypothetical protein